MSLILLNLQSNQQIELDNKTPLIIGRKNVEGCFDKRVSRSHGRVTCTGDGKVRLEALHCNPCFFTRNGVPPVLQLNKDEEETLGEGDCLGLLPNAFWFKITSSQETKDKVEVDNSDIKSEQNSEENRTNQFDETISIRNSETNNTTMTIKTESVADPATDTNVAGSFRFGSAEFEKTRRLPLSMYEIDEPTVTQRTSVKCPSTSISEKGKKQKLLTETNTNAENKTEGGAEKTNLNVPSTSKIETVSASSSSTTNLQNITQAEGETSKGKKKEGYESDVDFDEDEAARRPICQYEGNCYRQNPQHKIEFCHPGDSDYVPYEKRPLCQYGASCYRQNEKHRVEFRHPPRGLNSSNVSPSSSLDTLGEERPPCLSGSSCRNENPQHRKEFYHPPKASSPLPAKRRRKKIKTQNVDYEDDDDDEYDLEDPFLNDATSDEYVPSDSDEEEEEFNASRDDD